MPLKHSGRCVSDHRVRILRRSGCQIGRVKTHTGTFPRGISDSRELVFSLPSTKAAAISNAASEIRDISLTWICLRRPLIDNLFSSHMIDRALFINLLYDIIIVFLLYNDSVLNYSFVAAKQTESHSLYRATYNFAR